MDNATSPISSTSTLKRKREDERSMKDKIEQVFKKHKSNQEPFPYPELTEQESTKVKKLLNDSKTFVCCLSRTLMSNPGMLVEVVQFMY
jgi:hypothetical protein